VPRPPPPPSLPKSHAFSRFSKSINGSAKASSAAERKAKLARLKAAVEAHADDIVAAVLEDTRKPEGEIRVTEVLNIVGNVQRNIDNLDAWMTPTRSPHP
jgi:acyl-CoA reductase-like NAD-dependent aldehyde dehydrogenase